MFRKSVTQTLVSVLVAVLICVLFIAACAPSDGTTPPPAQSSKIEDLAYIKILASSYSDDPDPEADGIALDVSFYDSKSEPVTFRDIPVTVTIELYSYSDVLDTFNHEKMELVYQQQVTVDHSMRISEMFGKYIRIPFENVTVDQSKYYEFGTMKVTVTTPKQGDFQDMEDLVRLYPAGGTTPPPAQSSKIEDLAYIKILDWEYSDDADPETEGISVDIMYYDSKSEYIDFQGIPVVVTIQLYGYQEVVDSFDHEMMEFVYQTQVTVDHSVNETFGKYIRIPFENITVDQNKYYEFGTIKVTVITPEQGDFQDMKDLVRLYPED